MVPFGKVFARKPEDWFSGSLLSSFAVSRFGKKRKTPEKPWNILSGPSWATLPDHSSAQNYQLRKVIYPGRSECLDKFEERQKAITNVSVIHQDILANIEIFEIRDTVRDMSEDKKYDFSIGSEERTVTDLDFNTKTVREAEDHLEQISELMENLKVLSIIGNHIIDKPIGLEKIVRLRWGGHPLETVLINKNDNLTSIEIEKLKTTNLIISLPYQDYAIAPGIVEYEEKYKDRITRPLGKGLGNNNLTKIKLSANVKVDNLTIGRAPKLTVINYDIEADPLQQIIIQSFNRASVEELSKMTNEMIADRGVDAISSLAGCTTGGFILGGIGTVIPILGTTIGGLVGCLTGGVGAIIGVNIADNLSDFKEELKDRLPIFASVFGKKDLGTDGKLLNEITIPSVEKLFLRRLSFENDRRAGTIVTKCSTIENNQGAFYEMRNLHTVVVPRITTVATIPIHAEYDPDCLKGTPRNKRSPQQSRRL